MIFKSETITFTPFFIKNFFFEIKFLILLSEIGKITSILFFNTYLFKKDKNFFEFLTFGQTLFFVSVDTLNEGTFLSGSTRKIFKLYFF